MIDENLQKLIEKQTSLKNRIQNLHLFIDKYNLRLNGESAKEPEKSIYEEMADVHFQFIENFQKSGNLENVKHALFLQWFGALEPGILTGIGDLPDENQIKVFNIILGLKKEDFDSEFRSMLFIMDEIGDFYFDFYEKGRNLRKLIENLRTCSKNHKNEFSAKELSRKGEMGDYFKIYIK